MGLHPSSFISRIIPWGLHPSSHGSFPRLLGGSPSGPGSPNIGECTLAAVGHSLSMYSSASQVIPPLYWEVYTKRPYPLLSQGAALQNTRFGGNGIFCNTTTWLLETKPDSCKPRICLFLFWLGRWIADGLVLICLSSGVNIISVSQAPKRQTKTNPERRNDQAREGAMTEDGFTTADFVK